MRPILYAIAILSFTCLQPSYADDGQKLLTIDHYVGVRSEVPAIAGEMTRIYVREVVQAGAALRGPVPPDRVVLFVHGAGTPAEVAFDVAYQDYSWMGYLARAGFDVFAMDMTGYGRSTRPAAMNDPCNLTSAQQAGFIPALIPAACPPSYPHRMTTIASDWNDIGNVVDHLRALRARTISRSRRTACALSTPILGSTRKVFVDLACSSHNAAWEKNHLLLFRASLDWLTQGTVDGKQEGMLRLGY
jgi:hypothetical protein